MITLSLFFSMFMFNGTGAEASVSGPFEDCMHACNVQLQTCRNSCPEYGTCGCMSMYSSCTNTCVN